MPTLAKRLDDGDVHTVTVTDQMQVAIFLRLGYRVVPPTPAPPETVEIDGTVYEREPEPLPEPAPYSG